MDDFHLFVFAYDAGQKLDNYYEMEERAYFDRTGMSPESPEAREWIAMLRKNERPLVEVGPFVVVFVDDDIGKRFSVRGAHLHTPLVELGVFEQSKHLHLLSSLEKNWKVPRFRANLHYLEDGTYEMGSFSILSEDGTLARRYFDLQGIGVFDIMHVFENGIRHTYHLNGLTWERVDDEPESLD